MHLNINYKLFFTHSLSSSLLYWQNNKSLLSLTVFLACPNRKKNNFFLSFDESTKKWNKKKTTTCLIYVSFAWMCLWLFFSFHPRLMNIQNYIMLFSWPLRENQRANERMNERKSKTQKQQNINSSLAYLVSGGVIELLWWDVCYRALQHKKFIMLNWHIKTYSEMDFPC